jgi:hypothetical protein
MQAMKKKGIPYALWPWVLQLGDLPSSAMICMPALLLLPLLACPAVAQDYHGQHLDSLTITTAMPGSNFTDATLDSASFTLPAQGWQGALLRGLEIRGGTLTGGSGVMAGVDARRARWTGFLISAGAGGFAGANFTDTAFLGCRITGPGDLWQGADLTGAVFRRCDLSSAGNPALAGFTSPPRYDAETRFPPGFNPTLAGWQVLDSSLLETEIIRLRGESAAGTGGLPHWNFGGSATGPFQRLAFSGTVSGSGVTTANETALWLEAPGAGPSLVARQGNEAVPGTTFRNFSNFTWQAEGSFLFESQLNGTGVTTANDRVWWLQRPDEAGLPGSGQRLNVARMLDAFPTVPGSVLKTFSDTAASAQVLTFQGSLVTGTAGVTAANDGLIAWQWTRPFNGSPSMGTWNVLAREAGLVSAADLPPSTTYNLLRSRVRLDSSTVVFSAVLNGFSSTQNNALFSYHLPSAVNRLIARADTGLPGLPGDPAVIKDFSGESLLEGTGTAFRVTLRQTDGTATPATTAAALLYRSESSPTLVPVARLGAATPASQTTYATLSDPAVTSGAAIFWTAKLAGPAVTVANDLSFWVLPPGTPNPLMLAREGDAAPGLPGLALDTLTMTAVGPAGHTALYASLAGPGITTENNTALWWGDGTPAGWQLVFRKGMFLNLPGGVSKKLTGLALSGVTPGTAVSPSAACLDAAGGLCFSATWSGGAGLLCTRPIPDCVFPPTPDTDGDGLRDEWEIAHGLNPNDPSDAAKDLDGDGLTNLQEYAALTDPHLTDADGDGVNDGGELALGTDPAAPAATPSHPVTALLIHHPLR